MADVKSTSTGDVDEGKNTTVHYFSFNGKCDTFVEWKIKTLSLARKNGFDKY